MKLDDQARKGLLVVKMADHLDKFKVEHGLTMKETMELALGVMKMTLDQAGKKG